MEKSCDFENMFYLKQVPRASITEEEPHLGGEHTHDLGAQPTGL